MVRLMVWDDRDVLREASQRRKPYTTIGIKRVPCFRCGGPSSQQWQICADGNQYRAVCLPCDIALNKIVLEFMGVTNVGEVISGYRERMGGC